MTRSPFIFLLLILASALLAVRFTAPVPAPSNLTQPLPAWTLADVRLLDPADAAVPTLDLLAIYLHPSGAELDLRLDFLDSAALPDYDLTITLDVHSHGEPAPAGDPPGMGWEAMLVIPAHGPLRLLDIDMQPMRGAGMRVVRDPTLDQLTVRISGLPRLNGNTRAQVFVSPAGSTALADQSGPTSTAAGLMRPARLGLVFTNAFPAYSPATALRRWHGAHTGPLGGSHGLGLLLSAAQQAGTPMALAGLRRPEALAALDTVGALPKLIEMEQQGLLVLPADTTPTAAPDQTARRFGLSSAPVGKPIYGNSQALALGDPLQVVDDGPSLALRRALIAAALSENAGSSVSGAPAGGAPAALILGGELPNSAWGAANYARSAFRFLTSRPWVRFLTAAELSAYLPPPSPQPEARFSPALSAAEQAELLAALQAAPDNNLGQAARQAYAALFAPVYPAAALLPQLRRGYTGVVWSLIYAAAWAEQPQARLDCASDPDHDGQAECLLADERRYVQFESESGALTYLFSLDENGAHQWVGPSAQMIVGMSDAQGWDLTRGLLADPAVIPGAFYGTGLDANTIFQAAVEDGRLIFSAGGALEKIYSLQAGGLHTEYRGGSRLPASIPLGLAPDPWRRFEPGWASHYTWSRSADGHRVSIQPPGAVTAFQVRSSCPLAARAFSDSAQWLERAENPDREYPAGHYLPFPMFLIECTPGTQTETVIEIGE